MSRSISSRYGVLRHRDFRYLLIDRFLAPSAFAFSMVGVSFAVLGTTHSTADLSYVLAAQIAPNLVFAPLGGVLADRIKPQHVIAGLNVMIAVCEGVLGLLVLTHSAQLWQMIVLEAGTGTAVAVFYPASTALLPRLVPDAELQQAGAISRLVMNGATMGGAAAAGFVVAGVGPGWALIVDALGMLASLPPNLLIRAAAAPRGQAPGVLRELREGWQEFRAHTWLWAIVAQYSVIMMVWYGSFSVLGPAVAAAHLGGAAAWGAIMAAESVGFILGGLLSLRYSPRRPMLFVTAIGATVAIPPLSLAMLWPVWLICLASLGVGIAIEAMMVVWTVAMARYIPADRLARVAAYDALGTVMSMPLGALLAGPIGAAVGVAATQYGAVVIILAATAVTLLSHDIRTRRADDAPVPATTTAATLAPATPLSGTESALAATAISSEA